MLQVETPLRSGYYFAWCGGPRGEHLCLRGYSHGVLPVFAKAFQLVRPEVHVLLRYRNGVHDLGCPAGDVRSAEGSRPNGSGHRCSWIFLLLPECHCHRRGHPVVATLSGPLPVHAEGRCRPDDAGLHLELDPARGQRQDLRLYVLVRGADATGSGSVVHVPVQKHAQLVSGCVQLDQCRRVCDVLLFGNNRLHLTINVAGFVVVQIYRICLENLF
uniref:(northern house mosquito) hypothetical protein n=1 Tax=Culex pipiens TaxID=7175 RepID=A0A8D8JP35_CULPI